MAKKFDINEFIGKQYGDWQVLGPCDDPRPGTHFECLCKCGKIQNVQFLSIKLGRSKRCWDCGRSKTTHIDKMLGKKFGKWLVLQVGSRMHKSVSFICRCDCGTIKEVHGPSLRSGGSKQCQDCAYKIQKSHYFKHNKSNTPLYKIWSSMKHRCNNPSNAHYSRYGGRGIQICEQWNEFENFMRDMGERPKGMTLDRIDNNGPYSPENCRWVTHKENCNNRGHGGKSTSKSYKIWHDMNYKCKNVKSHAYPRYGARGIKVCDKWQTFNNFYEDMGEPKPGYVFRRKNNDLDFTPKNCHYVPKKNAT